MSSGRMRFYSVCQMGQTNFTYVLPNDVPDFMKQGNPHYSRPTKTLYLLHGVSGNDADWENNGIAEDLSLEYNLAVIMPTAGNNFYLNREATGCQYQDFTGRELIDFTRRTFGLSSKKEDTLIGGLSMGGYGAMHTALAYPDTFFGAICLSSALIIHEITGMKEGEANSIANYAYYREVFGELSSLDQTEVNPEIQYLRLLEKGKEIPYLYMAIGTEDFLYTNNQITRKFFEEHGAAIKYDEGPGSHTWEFWNPYICKGLDWLLAQD